MTSSTQAPASITQTAYQKAMNELLPASPEMIKAYFNRLDKTRGAIHAKPPPNLLKRTFHLSAAPGSKVPRLNLTPGYVAAITFVDTTGEPWPVSSVSVGNPNWFDISLVKSKTGNQLVVSATGSHLSSNLTVGLEGAAMPVAIELRTDAKQSDAVAIVRMDTAGPNADSEPVQSPASLGAAPVLTQFMNYTPPEAAVPVEVDTSGVKVWAYRGYYYVRTRLAALWPAWDAATTLGGTHVYRMPRTASMLFSRSGSHVRVTVGATSGASAGEAAEMLAHG
jgi:intracellular multiplication protein IcmK